jgi:hypothetical protein
MLSPIPVLRPLQLYHPKQFATRHPSLAINYLSQPSDLGKHVSADDLMRDAGTFIGPRLIHGAFPSLGFRCFIVL